MIAIGNGALTQEILKSRLTYEPRTGEFFWLVKPAGNVRIGQLAGSPNSDGYIQIRIFGVLYKAHRLAWLYMTGQWPAGEIDHRDGDTTNNRWINLREATREQNCQNRRLRKDSGTGVKGVGLNRKTGKWTAYVKASGVVHHLGSFDTKAEAEAVRTEAAKRLHGAFSSEGQAC